MLLLPLKVNVLFPRFPTANVTIIAINCFVFILQMFIPNSAYDILLLNSWTNPIGWITSLFLHDGFFHIIGNMIFLWVFGNAICSKIGNLRYLGLYFIFGLSACFLHLTFSDIPALGASGAVNGVIGFYFALYPNNYMNVLWGFIPFYVRKAEVTSKWIVLYWFFWDIVGALWGSGQVAYWAHIGGFLGGFIMAGVFLKLKLVEFRKMDNEHLFEKIFSRFNIDEITEENFDCLLRMSDQEFRIKDPKDNEEYGPYNNQELQRMMETDDVNGQDLVYCVNEKKWMHCSRYFTINYLVDDLGIQLKKARKKVEIPKELYRKIYGRRDMMTVGKAGEKLGPYNGAQLADLLRTGEIVLTDYIFDLNLREWVLIEQYFSSESFAQSNGL